MPTRERDRLWLTQPFEAAPPNWASQLASGLVVVGVGGAAFNQRTPRLLTVGAGTPTIASGIAGRGPTFTTGLQRFTAGAMPVFAASTPFTIEVLCAITAAPSLAGFASLERNGAVQGTTRGLIAFGGGSNRNIYFWGGSADLASGVDWRTDGSLQHVFVTSGGASTTMRFYRDGAQIASGTTPSTLDNTLATSLWQVGDTNQTWNSVPTGTIFKHALYNRELSAGEVAALSANPWQIFQARRIWVPVSAGGASGTVAYTNANDADSITGTTTVVGTSARTNAADTSSASGTTTVTGSVARTNANDADSISGTTTVVGTSARTNANDTSSASGTVGSSGVSGSVAYTNAADTSLASGTTTIVGSAAVTAANDPSTATGTTAIVGTVAYTNANDTSAATDVTAISVVQPYVVVRFWKRTA